MEGTGMMEAAQGVRARYPNARFGVLTVSGLGGKTDRAAIDALIAGELAGIRAAHEGYERKAALAAEPLCYYAAYYKRFKKTYHVLGQLESVLLKGRGIPPVGPAVEAMFLAEIKNLLLSAGHDLDVVEGDLRVEVAEAPLPYEGMGGRQARVPEGDIYLRDEAGVLSSIIGGPDERTKITDKTQKALYFVYGVEGIAEDALRGHLQTIAGYLTAMTQGVQVESMEIL